MDYNHVAEIACWIVAIDGTSIDFQPILEVGFDCSGCQRCGRTIRFNDVGRRGICMPAEKCDGFIGVLHSFEPFEFSGKTAVRYQIKYDYTPFLDKITGNVSNDEPAWGRITFDTVCGMCGSSTQQSTQSNLVRPHSVYCHCGAHLYDDVDDMPLLRVHMGDPT